MAGNRLSLPVNPKEVSLILYAVRQGTTSGRLDTYYGAGRLGGAPGHLMKTVVPKPEDAAASVPVKPVRETPAGGQTPHSQPPGIGHSSHSNSSASSGMSSLAQLHGHIDSFLSNLLILEHLVSAESHSRAGQR